MDKIITAKPQRKRNVGKSIGRFLKNFDIFGHKISLTYEGMAEYKSALGGVVSIIILSLIFSYFMALLV